MKQTYTELANDCGSVPELMFKIEIYGKKWTKWDWAMFLSFLSWDLTEDDKADCTPRMTSFVSRRRFPACIEADSSESHQRALLLDFINTIDGSDELDEIVTNKLILLSMIEWAQANTYGQDSVLTVLSHIFKKFPRLWSMNWMFIRHKSGKLARTHRLQFALPLVAKRPAKYFESDAFMDDFIRRYFNW